MTELVRYDAACGAVAEAKSVDEAKQIRDVAVAMKAYARLTKNRDLEADAIEIRRRLVSPKAQQTRIGKKPALKMRYFCRVVHDGGAA
jgi:precorrin-2 methylase